METTTWLVHEPFHYFGGDRIDFEGEFATEGRLAHFLRYGRWEGTTVAGRFFRQMSMGNGWVLEEGVVNVASAKSEDITLTAGTLCEAAPISGDSWNLFVRRLEEVS